jgi:manganese transport protein
VIKKFFQGHKPKFGGLEILKYIGPGFIVTIGFIDPGNWASNIAAGSQFGYNLLWVVTLSTVMLIFIQHNAAHLGIVTGLCLSEASTEHLKKPLSRIFLGSAVFASISTALAEILGAAIGINMLFHIPIFAGALITSITVIIVLYTNTYRLVEKYIIGFVAVIGFSFLYELFLSNVNWTATGISLIAPSFPKDSIVIIMCVLGAVVMPHNIFLHSEVIQSRQLQNEGEGVIKKRLKFEFFDTLIAMIAGWAINSAMIIVAAAVFFSGKIEVTELQQAQETLRPLLGNSAAFVFAIALLFAGISSSITASMAGASIFAGIFKEPLDLKDSHSRIGVFITITGALIAIFFLENPFTGLIWSQVILSLQLPWTIFVLIYLTSSKKIMGEYKNTTTGKILLWIVGLIVTYLNIMLIINLLS